MDRIPITVEDFRDAYASTGYRPLKGAWLAHKDGVNYCDPLMALCIARDREFPKRVADAERSIVYGRGAGASSLFVTPSDLIAETLAVEPAEVSAFWDEYDHHADRRRAGMVCRRDIIDLVEEALSMLDPAPIEEIIGVGYDFDDLGLDHFE